MSVLNKEIMVVDDDAESRLLVRKALESLGANVIECASLKEARAQLALSLPHAIVTDLNMPDEDGFALLDEVRAARGKKVLPILVLSGMRGKEHSTRALAQGADDFLSKPFNVTALLQKLKKLFSTSDFLKVKFEPGSEPTVNAVVPINVRSLNEISGMIECKVKLAPNVAVLVDAPILRELELGDLPMKRTSFPGVLTEKGSYANSIAFIGVPEPLALSVRKIVRTWKKADDAE